MAKLSMKNAALTVGAGAFLLALGIAPAHSEETIIEKHTAESHSYKVEENAPVVQHGDVVTEHTEEHTTERIPPAAVVEKRTTVETIPAAPVVQRRTTETVHTED